MKQIGVIAQNYLADYNDTHMPAYTEAGATTWLYPTGVLRRSYANFGSDQEWLDGKSVNGCQERVFEPYKLSNGKNFSNRYYSYAMNFEIGWTKVGGVAQSLKANFIRTPSQQVQFFENQPDLTQVGANNSSALVRFGKPHQGAASCSFADGHAASVRELIVDTHFKKNL